jgi:oligopeptide/dipeptide ABC transporter ATP-binding protein
MQLIFQDPQSSLDPRMKVGQIVEEPMEAHGMLDDEGREDRAKELLEKVGLDPQHYNRYPHAFSGGQRQRVNLARALSVNPDFIVCDEPVSALDVSIQAQVLNTMRELQEEFDLTYLFIAHDLSVIRHISDRVAVMYLGQLVELADKEELYENPQHPYTRALLESIPVPDPRSRGARSALEGDVPSPIDPPSGCRFRTRCPKVIPPADVNLSQEAYRAVMDVRGRIERYDISLDEIQEGAEEDTVASALAERLLPDDIDLPERERQHLHVAFESLADGEWEAAADHLADRYRSICETHAPDGERAACHLNGLPEDVPPGSVDRVETRD